MKSKRGYNLTACSQELSCPAFTGKKRKVLKESIIPIQDTPSPVETETHVQMNDP